MKTGGTRHGVGTPEGFRTIREEERRKEREDPLRGTLVCAVRSGTLGDPPEPRGIRPHAPWRSCDNLEHPRRVASHASVRVVRSASTRTVRFVRQRRTAAAASSVRPRLDRPRTASHHLTCAFLGHVVFRLSSFVPHLTPPSLFEGNEGVRSHPPSRTRMRPGLFGFDPGSKGRRSGLEVPLKRKTWGMDGESWTNTATRMAMKKRAWLLVAATVHGTKGGRGTRETSVMHLERHVRAEWTDGGVDGMETNQTWDGAPGVERHHTTLHRRTATCREDTWVKSEMGHGFATVMFQWKPTVCNADEDACRNPTGEKFGEWTQDRDVHETCTASEKEGMLSCRSKSISETASNVVGTPETSASSAWGRSGALVQRAVGNRAQLFIAFVCLMLHLLAG